MSHSLSNIAWRRLHFRRPITPEQVVEVLRLLAHDPHRPFVAMETRTHRGQVYYLLGAPSAAIEDCVHVVTSTLPGTLAVDTDIHRPTTRSAAVVSVQGTERPLRRDHAEAATRAMLAAATRRTDSVVVQIILGDPRAARLAVDAVRPPLLARSSARPDGEARAAHRQKHAEPSFGCVIRIGSSAQQSGSPRGLFQALSTLEAAGVRLRAARQHPSKLDRVQVPWRWPQHLNIAELAAVTCWPVGEADLPGIAALHPVVLPPGRSQRRIPDYVVATPAAPGFEHRLLGLDVTASLCHLWALGPPGVGKSVLLTNLVLQDIAAGRGALFLEPKGDAVADVLARIPAHRREDVVILDPTDTVPVGLNPLSGGQPDVRAEGLLEVFTSLFGDAIGPRSRDVLHSALLTLARRGDASLAMLSLLLTNTGFRRSITQHVVADDPLALGAFWSWYESLSDAERSTVIAPVLNKVRIFTTNRRLRAVVGQRRPRFDLQQIFTENKILLVPLQSGVLGQSAARLLGSLVVAELVQVARSRTVVPERERRPVMVTIDELHQYMHIADLGEALALFRGYGIGFRLANQHLAQLPPNLRDAMLGTVRSRVIFQTNHHDAAELAKGHPEVDADDLTALPAFAIYASLMDGNTATGYVSGVTRPLGSAITNAESIRSLSRTRYGQALDEIEADLAALASSTSTTSTTPTGRKRRTS